MKRAVAVLALVVAATACGREGALVTGAAPAAPASAGDGFCDLAARLEREASVALRRLGPNAPEDQVLLTLRAFGATHLAEYRELERLAPAELKPRLRAQRDFRRRLPSIPAGPQRNELLQRAVANGTAIKRFEVQICRRPPVSTGPFGA